MERSRGWNLRAGQKDGDRGRRRGGRARAKAYNGQPAPADCVHCQHLQYTTMAQHIGHLGFRAVMENHPTALHSLRDKVKRTGLESTRARLAKLRS